MTIKRFTDRSRIETHLRCRRRRWLEYEEGGTGIAPSRKPLPLAVGGAIHRGLESMLRSAMEIQSDEAMLAMVLAGDAPAMLRGVEESAVRAAIADFSEFAGCLDADDSPAVPASNLIQIAGTVFDAQLAAQAAELGMDPAAFRGPSDQEKRARGDAWLFAEQSALVEALVRAYARRRLRPLLEEFEVLEVEREGEWILQSWNKGWYCEDCHGISQKPALRNRDVLRCSCGSSSLIEHEPTELWFMSRPDALLRHRQTNELQILSFKTTGAWDLRKARDIQHDMQGLSEGVEVERRLGEWWQAIQDFEHSRRKDLPDGCQGRVIEFLRLLPSPPRVSAIRYEFLLKGERWKDKDLSSSLGIDGTRVQKSHLLRQYVAVSTPSKGANSAAFRIGDVCWSNDFIRVEDQKSSNLAWQNWKSRPVWEGGTNAIREWIDQLDRSELLMSGEDSTVGMEPRALGYRSDAQAMGVTAEHPLDAVFVPPITVSRNDDQLRDWVEQVAEQERAAAEAAALVHAAGDPGEKRSLLNRLFPQTRSACEYPTQCGFARERVGMCWGGAEIQADPLGVSGGEYVRRVANHPQELQK